MLAWSTFPQLLNLKTPLAGDRDCDAVFACGCSVSQRLPVPHLEKSRFLIDEGCARFPLRPRRDWPFPLPSAHYRRSGGVGNFAFVKIRAIVSIAIRSRSSSS